MAASSGFEPKLSGPKPEVLPLHYEAVVFRPEQEIS